MPASLQPHPPPLVTLPRPHQHSLFLHQAEHSLISEPPHRLLPVPEMFFAPLPAWPTPPAGLSSNLFFFIEVQLIYNIVLVWGVQQSGSVIYMCVCVCVYIFKILFHYYNIEHSSLCYMVNTC